MGTLNELARLRTDLTTAELGHLQRLVGTWGLLSDFCFADLLLFAPVTRDESGAPLPAEELEGDQRFVVLDQVRPATGQTVYQSDWVGAVLTSEERPIVARAFSLEEIIESETKIAPLKELVRILAIPVRYHGKVIAVLTRESTPSFGRQSGDLERAYVEVFGRFARMIARGEFPFPPGQLEPHEAPRVGDGVILLDRQQRVVYASPNAVSALHRVGVHANAEAARLGELGLDEDAIHTAFETSLPQFQELERGQDITILFRCIPLLDSREVSGAVVLLRDVSELRRRDRLLLSKDATIQEIHHRVKNNLQTISSLLRLQGRRLSSPEAKAAIEESVRRVRSIALVHEILSREAGDDVPFVDIVRPVTRMVEDAFRSPERTVRCTVEGDAGMLPAHVATPLAVVLNELLQNAYDHAFPVGKVTEGRVAVVLARDDDELRVTVTDDGVGAPDDFNLEEATGLGLSIVRTLVTSELAGTIEVRDGNGSGDRPGTTIELTLPVHPPAVVDVV